MKTPWAIHQIQKLTLNYVSLCTNSKCYGTLAIHRICFALSLFHLILSTALINVHSTTNKRAAIQNGWWGPKVVFWLVLVGLSFLIPDGFFVFWGNWVALLGAIVFILIGLVLLVDFAHGFTEMCLEKWENSTSGSNLWQYILVGSTFGLYAFTIAITVVMYVYFAGSGCTLNQFFITFNLILCILITLLCISPPVQEANPKSGLAQASMVAAYCAYLILSAVGNHTHATCNPLHKSAGATQTTTVIIGGVFTFIAIAYSTTRAATLSKAFTASGKKDGAIALTGDDSGELGIRPITSQPTPKNTPRYQALVAAVEAGAIPASALNDRSLYRQEGDIDSDDEAEDGAVGEERDDERVRVKYNYSWFHIIFAMAAMYVAMLLTDWQFIKKGVDNPEDGKTIYIGRSDVTMWMRIISSWISILLYTWSLLAPVVMPDRFGDFD